MAEKETVSWDDFKRELTNHVGVKRAQSIFSEQTGYEISIVQYWKSQGVVPRSAYDKIEGIEIGACDSERFKGYHTRRFFDRVVDLSNCETPIKQIAAMLSREMNRKITEGAVKSARFRMKERIPGYRTRGP